MSNAIQATIIEHLHRLDEQRQSEVLDVVEYLASKAKAAPAVNWPAIDPARDMAPFIGAPQERPKAFDPMRYSGTVQWPVDGLAYQESVRREWE